MSPEDRPQETGHEDVFVARQPIFDRKEQVWGYELLFRASGRDRVARVSDSATATARVIADGFVLAHAGMDPGQRVLINFPENLLVQDAAFALPKDICIVEILEDVEARPEVLDALKRLKQAGYTLAMDDYAGEPVLEPFLGLVDLVKVDILTLGADKARIEKVAGTLKKYKCLLLAEKVEDLETFAVVKNLGFALFQGFFFSKPEIIPGKKISAGEIAKLRLLQELGNPDFEVKKLSGIIHADLSLSYRLFQYINSAGMGVRHKVESVTRAVTLIGQRQLVQWLRAVIMADLSPSKKAEELAFMSVHRGRFLELLAIQTDACRRSPETMFLLGLFSFLDAMLGQPMVEIVEPLPLDPEVKAALIGQENELLDWLRLVSAYERGYWEDVSMILGHRNLGPEDADRPYVQAMAWTQRILGKTGDGQNGVDQPEGG